MTAAPSLDTPRVPFSPDGIPAELRARPQWVTWQLVRRGKDPKPTKVPRDPLGPRHGREHDLADTTDPTTWALFADACATLERKRLAGAGFVFSPDDPYVGIDLDNCRDPETGQVEPWALEIVQDLASYTEVSQSGAGLKAIARGLLPGPGRNRVLPDVGRKVELYDQGRFFALTGHHLEGTPATIERRPAQVLALYARLAPPVPAPAAPAVPAERIADDDELLERAGRAANGGDFEGLYRGDTSKYRKADGSPDLSGASLALCNLLAFWTDDADQIDRIVRRSALYRPKWDSRRGASTWGRRTIDKALAERSAAYGSRRPATRRHIATPTAPQHDTAPVPDGTPACHQRDCAAVRAELEELRATIADLTRSNGELRREVAEVRHHQALVMDALAGTELGSVHKIVAIVLAFQHASSAARGQADPIITREMLAERAGISADTAGRAVQALCGPGGLFTRRTERATEEVADPATGEIRAIPRRDRKVTRYSANYADLGSTLRAIRDHRPTDVKRHGGRREPRCPEHPAAPTATHSVVICAAEGCGRVLAGGEGLYMQVAATRDVPLRTVDIRTSQPQVAGTSDGHAAAADPALRPQDACTSLLPASEPVTWASTNARLEPQRHRPGPLPDPVGVRCLRCRADLDVTTGACPTCGPPRASRTPPPRVDPPPPAPRPPDHGPLFGGAAPDGRRG